MARQLVRPQVDFAAVGEAGMVRNYEGEALAAVGQIIGEAISNYKPKADIIDEQETNTPVVNPPPGNGDNNDNDNDNNNNGDENNNGDVGEEIKDVDEKIEKEVKGGGNLDIYYNAFAKFTDKRKNAWTKRGKKSGRSGVDDYIYHMENELPPENIKARETVRDFAKSKPKGFVYDPMNKTHVNEFKASKYYNEVLPYNFLSDSTFPGSRLKDTPLDRQRSSSVRPTGTGLAGMSNERQFNYQAGAGATKSQLPAEGKTFVEKQRYLRTPSWASGGAVAAAIEGWNIGVEASNYRAQVAADKKDFEDREWKSMQDQAKEDSLVPRSFLASSKALQQKYSAALNLPPVEKGEQITLIRTQLDDLERSKTVVMESQAFLKENWNNIAWDLVPPKQKDILLTLMRGGGINGFIPDENGKMAFQGVTRGEIPFKQTLDQITDPNNGLLSTLPMKGDIYGTMDTIANSIEKKDYTTTTIDADGIKRERPVPLDDLKNTIDFQLNKAISSTGLKSLASALPLYKGEKGLDAFNVGMKLPSDHPDHPINVVKDNMSRGVLHQLTSYLGQVDEEESKGLLESQKQANRTSLQAQKASDQRRLQQLRDANKNASNGGSNSSGASGSNGAGGSDGSNAKDNFGSFQVNELFKGGNAKGKESWFRKNIGPNFRYTKNRKDDKGNVISGVLTIPYKGDYDHPETQIFDMHRGEDVEQLLKIYGSEAGGKGADKFAREVSEAIEARRNKRKEAASQQTNNQDLSGYDFSITK